MLANGAHASSRNDLGGLLIHSECEGGLVARVEQQLASGIDVNVRDGAGRTPLYLAAAAGQLAMIWIGALVSSGSLAGSLSTRRNFWPLAPTAYWVNTSLTGTFEANNILGVSACSVAPVTNGTDIIFASGDR